MQGPVLNLPCFSIYQRLPYISHKVHAEPSTLIMTGKGLGKLQQRIRSSSSGGNNPISISMLVSIDFGSLVM